jgi:hypothetical protein
MTDAPTPTCIGDPGPTADWIPQPSSIVIRPPGLVVNTRNPDITIRGLISPTTIGGKLGFIFIEFRGEIRFLNSPEMKIISRFVPLGKTVAVTGI